MRFAQGHNTVTLVRLEAAAPGSRVKHSTTEPLRSHKISSSLTSIPNASTYDQKMQQIHGNTVKTHNTNKHRQTHTKVRIH